MEFSRRGFLGFGGSAAISLAGCGSFGTDAADGGAQGALEATKRWFKDASTFWTAWRKQGDV